MEKRVTVDGIEVRIDPEKISDIDIVELAVASSDEEAGEFAQMRATIALFKAVFGEEQYAKIKEAMRAKSENGVVTTQEMAEFFGKVGNASQALKK